MLPTSASPARTNLTEGEGALSCVRCGGPVVVSRADDERFERRHWLCFHLEFEHEDDDPDEPCSDPSCPWKRLRTADQRLEAPPLIGWRP